MWVVTLATARVGRRIVIMLSASIEDIGETGSCVAFSANREEYSVRRYEMRKSLSLNPLGRNIVPIFIVMCYVL